SLKLCRRGAYVNTKSAGVRSFLSKYFSGVKNIEMAQARINVVLDESFQSFSEQLHERHGLEAQACFGQLWREASLPELPGELAKEDQALLQEHYARMIALIYESLKQAFENERPVFDHALAALLG